MKFFIDTEFIEGIQGRWFANKPTIDLISVGIVCEGGREYYAISSDFNLKYAWNKFNLLLADDSDEPIYEYWVRDNVLLKIHYELSKKKEKHKLSFDVWKEIIIGRDGGNYTDRHYKTLKKLIKKYGKPNYQIADEIKLFVNECNTCKKYLEHKPDIEFYGYYSDYDWVVFCWLFGDMSELPKYFPMYCKDLKQILDEKVNNSFPELSFREKLAYFEKKPNYPKQSNEHNALEDAKWNYKLYEFLQQC